VVADPDAITHLDLVEVPLCVVGLESGNLALGSMQSHRAVQSIDGAGASQRASRHPWSTAARESQACRIVGRGSPPHQL
jgi:hypothetical protein